MDQAQPTDLELAIVRTLAWFSLFEQPLVSFEIWKWLRNPSKKYSLFEVEFSLGNSVWLKDRLVEKDGFWTLKNQSIENFIAKRQERFLDAAKKYKKLRLAARYFSLFPFVRGVFACNTLAWHNTTTSSDIDLFIVVKPGTIWTSRLLLVLPFALSKKRPIQNPFTPPLPPSSFAGLRKDRPQGYGRAGHDSITPSLHDFTTPRLHHSTTPDPFCFSFFVTSDNSDFKNLLLPDQDPYFDYWLASLVPIFDRDNFLAKLSESNPWLKETLPNSFSDIEHSEISIRSFSCRFLSFFSFFEPLLGRLQKKFLPCEITDVANRDSRVIISDKILKFHTNDRRIHFRDEWQKRLAKIL